jgi:peroxiredoxin
LREALADLDDQNAQLLAVDPHEVWAAKFLLKETGFSTDDLQYPLLMDPSLTVSATYGVTAQMRIHTEWSDRPATFIIDSQGIIRFEKRATTFGDRPSVEDVLRELSKLDAK